MENYRLVAFRPSTRSARAGRFFALKIERHGQHPVLVTFSDLEQLSSERVLLDPVALDATGRTSIDWFVPSPHGRFVAVSQSEIGAERGHVNIIDVATGASLADVVPRVNAAGGSLAWAPDSSGFYYARHPREIYFHELGTPIEQDCYEIGREFPHSAEPRISVSSTGTHVLVNVREGERNEFSQFLRMPDGTWLRLTASKDRIITGLFAPDRSLLLLSRNGAPNGKLLRLKLSLDRTPSIADAATVIPERREAAIRVDGGGPEPLVATSTRIYVVGQLERSSEISIYSLCGTRLGNVALPPVAAVLEMIGLPEDRLLVRSARRGDGVWPRHRARATYLCVASGILSTCPGLILSGSLN